MKKIRIVAAALVLLSALPSFTARAEPEVTVSALSAVVINGYTREILWGKDPEKELPMASTTKIMTSLLLIEDGLDGEVTVSHNAASTEGSSMGLREGDTVTREALLLGMLLESGNDAATATAEAVSGSVEKFALLMNERAEEIGMKNTCFVTPSGLDEGDHHTTAYDMALLTAEAMQNHIFRETVSAVRVSVTYGSPEKTVTFTNHNKLLSSFKGAVGVKTGYTRKSGRCLVSAAKEDGKFVIAVTLNDGNDWEDHEKLLRYGLDRVETSDITYRHDGKALPVVGSNVSLVELVAPDMKVGIPETDIADVTVETCFESFLYAPVKAGQSVGKVRYYYKGYLLGESKLYAGGDVAYTENKNTGSQEFIRCFRLLFSFYR